MRRTETIQYFSNTLRTNALQASVIYNQNSGIFIHGDVILGKVKMNQGLKATSFLMSGMKQWNLISHDDFDQVLVLLRKNKKYFSFRKRHMSGIIIKPIDVPR